MGYRYAHGLRAGYRHGPLEKADVLDCDGSGPLGCISSLARGKEAVVRERTFRQPGRNINTSPTDSAGAASQERDPLSSANHFCRVALSLGSISTNSTPIPSAVT